MERKFLPTFQKTFQKNKKVKKLFLFISILLKAAIFLMLTICTENFPSSANMMKYMILSLLFTHGILSVFLPEDKYLGFLSLLELFLFQIMSYIIPDFDHMLLSYMVLCLFEISLYFSSLTGIIICIFIGTLWCPVMSVYTQLINHDHLTRTEILSGYSKYVVCGILSAMFAYINGILNTLILIHKQEISVNKKLDAMNRSITSQMFAVKTESQESAKREVIKYVHDNIGYVLTNLIMMIQATDAVNRNNYEKGQQMLTECLQYSQQGLNEIRTFLHGVQSVEKSNINIKTEIIYLAKLFERCTRVQVIVQFDNWPNTFTAKINAFLLSFVKEGLTNAVKHSSAKQISIRCREKTRFRIEISISNNNCHSQESIQYGTGLDSINYELEQLGGTLTTKNSGNSFLLSASIPFVRFNKKSEESDLFIAY